MYPRTLRQLQQWECEIDYYAPTKLWVGIKIGTISILMSVQLTIYVCATPWWILFIPLHSDQHDIKIGFCDVAKFTWVMGLCHGGHPCPTDTFLAGTVRFCCYIYNNVHLRGYYDIQGAVLSIILGVLIVSPRGCFINNPRFTNCISRGLFYQ